MRVDFGANSVIEENQSYVLYLLWTTVAVRIVHYLQKSSGSLYSSLSSFASLLNLRSGMIRLMVDKIFSEITYLYIVLIALCIHMMDGVVRKRII